MLQNELNLVWVSIKGDVQTIRIDFSLLELKKEQYSFLFNLLAV